MKQSNKDLEDIMPPVEPIETVEDPADANV